LFYIIHLEQALVALHLATVQTDQATDKIVCEAGPTALAADGEYDTSVGQIIVS